MGRRKLVVIDAYSLLFRAFHAMPALSTASGIPTNALYGFVSMLFTLFEKEKPDAVLVALDAPGKTFRHHEYQEYKAQRPEAPDALRQQLSIARELIDAFHLPALEVTGYEADDLIATVATRAKEEGYDVVIVSGDLDQLQLVNSQVKVMTMRRGVTDVVYYDEAGVRQRYGLHPSQIPDLKALAGDPSDNIPGVKGIGEKTAANLLEKFGTIEGLLERWEELEEKTREKLAPYREQLKRFKDLATLRRDAEIRFQIQPYRLTREQVEGIGQKLGELEFRRHRERLLTVLGPYLKDGEPQGLLPFGEVKQERIPIQKEVVPEEGLRRWIGEESALCFEGGRAYLAKGLRVVEVDAPLAESLFREDPAKFSLHDAKPHLKRLRVYKPVGFDTVLAGYVLQPERARYDLEQLSRAYLGEVPETSEEKASAISRLKAPLQKELEATEQTRVFFEIELPLTPVLAEMENIGVRLDSDILRDYSKSLSAFLEQTRRRIYELAGEEFNIGSTPQLRRILFEKLKLPTVRRTKTGFSTGADVLLQLAPQHEIVQEILAWRELSKLKSTYVDALPELVGQDGRIHTTFQQTVAATGRLSSAEPNLQNIPIRTELGREIRRAFVADEGFLLASLDYSQIELRILAHVCEEPALVNAFQEDKDVHSATAALIWNKPEEEVTSEERRQAKTLNYAILYGVTDFGLATQLGGAFSVAETKQLISDYFKRFPAVREYIESTLHQARTKGYTTTLLGRRRYFPDIKASNRARRLYAERQAINAPLQGSAADMIKLAMIRCQALLQDAQTRMLLQVHDELLFEWKEEEGEILRKLRRVMEEALPLKVPVVVDVSVGKNWLELSPWRG
jgi:DNA polymerase-1